MVGVDRLGRCDSGHVHQSSVDTPVEIDEIAAGGRCHSNETNVKNDHSEPPPMTTSSFGSFSSSTTTFRSTAWVYQGWKIFDFARGLVSPSFGQRFGDKCRRKESVRCQR
ncbi:Uncharacterised protein r2_g2085 [Pycnogonum litorale]